MIIMNWLGCKGFRPVQTLNDRDQEKCKTNFENFDNDMMTVIIRELFVIKTLMK